MYTRLALNLLLPAECQNHRYVGLCHCAWHQAYSVDLFPGSAQAFATLFLRCNGWCLLARKKLLSLFRDKVLSSPGWPHAFCVMCSDQELLILPKPPKC